MEGREKHLKARYGFDHGEYLRLLALQDSKCAICFSEEPGKGFKYFHIDHNHQTREIRGLLCATCNQALGLLKDSPEYLLQALAYLVEGPHVPASQQPPPPLSEGEIFQHLVARRYLEGKGEV
jgi:hypothetical protein